MKKIAENIWEIPKTGKMKVAGRIFASEALMENIKNDEKTFEQIKNVAELPGIVGESIAMPDAHQGYGFCIGGVAGFDAENGIISPSAVGFDQNCGVRLLTTNLEHDEVEEKITNIAESIIKYEV